MKILVWDRNGFVLYYKRVSQGRFRMPTVASGAKHVQMDATTLGIVCRTRCALRRSGNARTAYSPRAKHRHRVVEVGIRYVANWQVRAEHHEIKDHSLAALDRQPGETLALLGAHVSLYEVHSATLESGFSMTGACSPDSARFATTGFTSD